MNRSTETFCYDPSSSVQENTAVRKTAYECDLDEGKRLSVVVPLYNERDNIQEVVHDLERTLYLMGIGSEIILVDDGSIDGTLEVIRSLQREYSNIRIFSHGINKGKTAAMVTGFQHSEGNYIVLMDGDGQFVAADIPKMIEKLEKGCDVVNGWGKKKEPLTKVIPSRIYNGISKRLFRLNVHQFNLGFKAFKREVLEDLILKRDEHRYILPLLKEKGFKIVEVPVEYLPRQNGTSKYGIMRIPTGVMDMISLKMEMVLGERPFRVFGLASSGLFLAGILLGLHTVYSWMSGSVSMWSFGFCGMFLLSGINMLFLGYAVEAAKHPRR